AFDPLEEGTLSALLSLPLLEDIVANSPCDCAPDDCPRRLAWQMLSSALVRTRVAEVARLARLVEPDWLFRDIWDLVANISLEGNCGDDPPSSTWFWRLFYGESRLSRAIREVADPITIPYPDTDSRLYFGDWNAIQLQLVDNLALLPISQPDIPERFAYA